MNPVIFFFHIGTLPSYLLYALESARYFNPRVRIFLISDRTHPMLSKLNVDCVSPESIVHPKLRSFLTSYIHISSCKVSYERRCFERWFYFEQLRACLGAEKVILLDSDAVLFTEAESVLTIMPEQFNFACSKAGGPALTMVRRSMEPFLDHILDRYNSRAFLERALEEQQQAQIKGEMKNLTDMTLCEEFSTGNVLGYVYPNHSHLGHVDHGIWLPDQMKTRKVRGKFRKKVIWKQEDASIIPYFQSENDDKLVKALLIHFQSKAKQLIYRFNPVVPSIWKSKAGVTIKLSYLEWAMS